MMNTDTFLRLIAINLTLIGLSACKENHSVNAILNSFLKLTDLFK